MDILAASYLVEKVVFLTSLWVFFFRSCIFNLFIYLFLAVLGLCFCARAFSSCGKWGPLFIAVRGPLIIAASLVAEHRRPKGLLRIFYPEVLQQRLRFTWFQNRGKGFPGCAVSENLPANAGNTGSSPGLGRSHMPWSN